MFAKRAVMVLLPLTLSACYMEIREDEKDGADQGHTQVSHPDEMPASLRGRADTCEVQRSPDGTKTWNCYQADDYTWRTSCKTESCQSVKVYAHYMLEDELGAGQVVQVEAFDNQYFEGAPTSQVRIANFAARRGEWRDAEIFLEPGEYYLRAYMTTGDDRVVPYTLGDMTLVGDQPVGVFGALSGAEMVRVAPRYQNRYPDPVHIYLDKLFKKPGSEPETNAHLRLNLTIADGSAAPDGRQVLIRLHKGRDLAEAPLAEFSMASELFLIQGRLGRAEFVSPSLKEGEYIVFAFVDANANADYDTGELAQVYSVNTQPAAVAIRKDRTESLSLTLAPDAVVVTP